MIIVDMAREFLKHCSVIAHVVADNFEDLSVQT